MLQTVREPDKIRNKSNMPNNDTNISPSSVVVCTEENLSCGLQEEAVVLNLKSGTYFGLNPLGARIWELIQQPAKVSYVHQELIREYEVDAAQCEADLLSFLKQLQKHSLITVQGADESRTSPTIMI